jgi:hypothetical protein
MVVAGWLWVLMKRQPVENSAVIAGILNFRLEMSPVPTLL